MIARPRLGIPWGCKAVSTCRVRSASIFFSTDGAVFFGAFTWNTSVADRSGDNSRWVTIPVNQTVEFVRVHLNDGTKVDGNSGDKPWIFISEAQVLGDVAAPEPGTIGLITIAGMLAMTIKKRK